MLDLRYASAILLMSLKNMNTDIYQIVTDKIIMELEKGTAPWRKSWKGGKSLNPTNFISKKSYRGINWLILNMSYYSCPFWLTYKQASELGGNVKKGEKGTQVVFWNFTDSKEKKNKNGDPLKVAFARYYTVFNVEQCEGLNYTPENVEIVNENEKIEAAEEIINNWKGKPEVSFGSNSACYIPCVDKVKMPDKNSFDTSDNFYSVFFHELIHSTGHVSRLNRLTENAAFGSQSYAKEELIAELGAAFLGATANLENTLEQSASYIQGWLKALKDDRKLILQAAGKAQAATDYILNEPTDLEESE